MEFNFYMVLAYIAHLDGDAFGHEVGFVLHNRLKNNFAKHPKIGGQLDVKFKIDGGMFLPVFCVVGKLVGKNVIIGQQKHVVVVIQNADMHHADVCNQTFMRPNFNIIVDGDSFREGKNHAVQQVCNVVLKKDSKCRRKKADPCKNLLKF